MQKVGGYDTKCAWEKNSRREKPKVSKENGNKKTKKGLSNTLKYFFGVGDAGFVLMSNIETFYFMTFLTDLAGFGAGIAGLINGVFTTVDACLSWLYRGDHQWNKGNEMGTLSFLADCCAVDGAVSLCIYVP